MSNEKIENKKEENIPHDANLDEKRSKKPKMTKSRVAVVLVIAAIIGVASVTAYFAVQDIQKSEKRMILATTTSTYDSGLLDYLLPEFEDDTGIAVEVLSLGTGQALAAAKLGDADLVLVHDRPKENLFVSDGYGTARVCVMFNDFILIGPKSGNPANIDPTDNITVAFNKLYNEGEAGNIEFYSRGDNSGTHSKEKAIWEAALPGSNNYKNQVNLPSNTWYVSTGAGMGDCLELTNQNNGYTLADRATWIAYQDDMTYLGIAVEQETSEDSILLNPYGVIPVNPDKFEDIKYDYAVEFVEFLISDKGQKLIEDYRIEGYEDESLFIPDYGHCDTLTGCTTTAAEQDIDWDDWG